MFVMKIETNEENNCSCNRFNNRCTALFANYYSGKIEDNKGNQYQGQVYRSRTAMMAQWPTLLALNSQH